MTLLPKYRAQIHEAAMRQAERPRANLGIRLPALASKTARALPVVFAVAVVVAVAAVALVTLHGTRSTSGPSQAAAGRKHAPQTVVPDWLKVLSRRFSVLAEPARGSVAPAAKSFIQTGVPARDLQFVRRVVLPAGELWIAPTPTEICIAFAPAGVHDLVGVTCGELAQAQRAGVRLSVGARIHPSSRVLGPSNPLRSWSVGLVTNGQSHVRVRTGAGKLVRSTVRENAFAVVATLNTSSH